MPRSENTFNYGWVVVAAFFAISTLMFGTLTSFGVFFKSIGGEFLLNRAAISAIFSLQNIFGSAMSFVGGWAVDRYGPKTTALFVGILTGLSLLLTSQAGAYWQLFITYSLLFSVIGVVYTLVMSTVSRWFDKNRGLAMGIAGTGIGLGTVIITPFTTYLVTDFGWRMAYATMGIIAWLVIVPLSLLIKRPPRVVGAVLVPGGDRNGHLAGFSVRKAAHTRSFWLTGAIWLLHAFSYFLVMIHLIPHATDLGIPAMEAATIVSLIGVSYIIGRLLMGQASDVVGGKKTAVACALVGVLAMLWLLWSQDLITLYIFGAVFGFANGGLDTSMATLVADTFGTRHLGSIMGTLQVNWGLGVVIGPAVGGLLFDANNSYLLAFIAGTAAMAVLAVLVAWTRPEIMKIEDR